MSLLIVLAQPSFAQDQQHQLSPTQAKPQAPTDYSKLGYQIPLVNEKANETVVGLAFSPDSKVIAVLYDKSIGFWATSTAAPIGSAAGTLEKFTALAFGPNGLLVTGGGDGRVAVWDWHDLDRPKLRTGGFNPITAVAVSPDGTLLVTAQRSEPPSVTVWDANTGKMQRTLNGFAYAPTALHFSPDGTQLLTGGGGLGRRTGEFIRDTPLYSTAGEFTRWNVQNGTLDKMVGVNDASPDCAFSPDGTLLAWVGSGAAVERSSTRWMGTAVRVWRVPGGGENDNGSFMPVTFSRELEFMVHNPGRPALAFSTDQRVLAFCESSHITLWSGGAGKSSMIELRYPSPDYPWDWYGAFSSSSGGAMAFSPDGKMMAVGGTARAAIWKIEK